MEKEKLLELPVKQSRKKSIFVSSLKLQQFYDEVSRIEVDRELNSMAYYEKQLPRIIYYDLRHRSRKLNIEDVEALFKGARIEDLTCSKTNEEVRKVLLDVKRKITIYKEMGQIDAIDMEFITKLHRTCAGKKSDVLVNSKEYSHDNDFILNTLLKYLEDERECKSLTENIFDSILIYHFFSLINARTKLSESEVKILANSNLVINNAYLLSLIYNKVLTKIIKKCPYGEKHKNLSLLLEYFWIEIKNELEIESALFALTSNQESIGVVESDLLETFLRCLLIENDSKISKFIEHYNRYRDAERKDEILTKIERLSHIIKYDNNEKNGAIFLNEGVILAKKNPTLIDDF